MLTWVKGRNRPPIRDRLTTSPTMGFVLALASVVAAYLLRYLIELVVGYCPPFRTFYPAIMLTAMLAGTKSGLLATALSSLAVTFFLFPPKFEFALISDADVLDLALFAATGAFMSAFAGLYHRAKARSLVLEQEQIRRESAQQYELLAEFSRDIILFVRPSDGRILEANTTAAQAYGYTREELLTFTVHTLSAVGTKEQVDDRLRQAAKGLLFRTVQKRKDGTSFPVEISSRGATVGDNDIIISVIRDITEAKEAEEALNRALAESEARARTLEAMMQSIPEGIVIVGGPPHFPTLEASRSAWEMIGGEDPRVLGVPAGAHQTVIPLFHKDGKTVPNREEMPLYRATHFGESVRNMELLYQHPNGRVRHLLIDAAPIRDGEGNIIGAVDCWRDISEMKRVEQALKDADSKKNEFLAVLAHELRNPMAAISAASRLLSTPNIPSEQTMYATKVVEHRVRQLSRLVDDLLDISRIIRGMTELRCQDLELSDVINQAVQASQLLIEEKHHSLAVDISDSLPVHGDPVRLEQIVTNLLTNAVRYTEQGGKLSLTAHKSDTEAVITLKDSGIGMTQATISRVFQMFGQADDSFHRSSGGLGLGLAIAKSLTEMHGGSISASSEGLGRGSEFAVRLPLATHANAGNLHEKQSADVKPCNILIAEDNKDTAITTAAILERQGHHILIAFDGRAAVEQALEKKPEVILLDLGLPELDGFEVSRAIRDSGVSQPLIIAVTGYGQRHDMERSRAAGIDHHLLKPLDYDKLSEILACHPVLQAPPSATAPGSHSPG